jgi:hypothetical protein
MDLTISKPIKIFALVAVIAAVGGAAMLMMKPKSSAAPIVLDSNATPAATGATATPAAAPLTAAKPAGTRTAPPTSVAPATKPVKAAPSPIGKNGLPLTIDAALHSHRIVVVSVFDPQSSTDAIAYAEAKAGAGEAGVGFVGVSLLDSTAAGALTTTFPGGGLLPSPGILIYRRPGMLVERLDGFNDRDVVAQAAAASVTAAPISGSAS